MAAALPFADVAVRRLKFEGITLRSDALTAIALVRDTAMNACAVARIRQQSAGATAGTLKRMAELGILETVQVPPPRTNFARQGATLTGYRCTALGKRLLDAAQNLLDDLEDQDPEANWPKVNTNLLVTAARETQPTSVFDLGRMAANSPVFRNTLFA